jgi:hypothetical protein
MGNRVLMLVCGVLLMFGVGGLAAAQDSTQGNAQGSTQDRTQGNAQGSTQGEGGQQPSARQELQHIHTPQSIDQELARLKKDLELTPEQEKQVRPLLEEHHDRIQALLDKNPNASRQQLGPQIHAISDETHGRIHALLTDHQKELEKAMQQREHHGGENRRSVPPAAASPEPSSSGS